MARTKVFQTNFTSGQLSPSVFGRIDSPKYYNGSSEITNGYCIPQGGLRKRGGLQFINSIPNAQGTVRVIPFEFGSPTVVEQSYAMLFSSGTLTIVNVVTDVVEATIPTPYSVSQVRDLDYAQSLDYMILTHAEVAPMQLVRTNSETQPWVLSPLLLVNVPQFQYLTQQDINANVFDLLEVRFDDDVMKDGDNYRVQFGNPAQVDSINIPFTLEIADGSVLGGGVNNPRSTGTGIFFTQDYILNQVANLQARVDAHFAAVNPSISDAVITVEPIYEAADGILPGNGFPTVYRTFRGFRLAAEGGARGLMQNFDLVRVNTDGSFNSAVWDVTPQGFAPNAGDVEDVWSTTRGWPRTVTFYENRLFFGGSRSRPATIWASRTNGFFDFSAESSDSIVADDFFELTIEDDQAQAIQAMKVGRTLQVFTTEGSYYFTEQALTPLASSLAKGNEVGSKRAKAVEYNDAIIYIQSSGNAIRDFVYEFANDKYISSVITSLASDIIQDAREMAVQRGVGTEEADYLYVLNAGDDSIAVFSGDKVQDLTAWSRFTPPTNSTFESMTVIDDQLYVVVKRVSGAAITHTLERLQEQVVLDGYRVVMPTEDGTATGLEHLSGMAVRVLDALTGDFLADVTVSNTGTINIPNVETEDSIGWFVGQVFSFKATSMPLTVQGVQGATVYDRKRVTRVILNLLNTADLYVRYSRNRRKIQNRKLPFSQSNQQPMITDYVEVWLNGYSRKTVVSLEQDSHLPCTILSAGYELEV